MTSPTTKEFFNSFVMDTVICYQVIKMKLLHAQAVLMRFGVTNGSMAVALRPVIGVALMAPL